MNSRHWQTALLCVLALTLTVELTYATIEFPRIVSGALIDVLGSGGETIDYSTGISEEFLRFYHIRTFGYASLILIVIRSQ